MRYGLVIDIESTDYLKTVDVFRTIDGRAVSFESASIQERANGSWKKELSAESNILSVGYLRVDLDSEKIIGAGTLYFYKPHFNVERATHIHGLTREFLSAYEDEFDKNLAKLESLMLNAVVIGKNSDAFDLPFIKLFLEKYRGEGSLYQFINTLGMKNYEKKRLRVIDEMISIDIQKVFAPMYRKLAESVYGVSLSGRKKGTVRDYVELLANDPNFSIEPVIAEASAYMTDEYQAHFHDAFYDVCATWLVFKFCKAIGL